MKRSFLRIAALLFIIGACASMGSATTLWSVDFENGWNASSGTPTITGGNLSNPYDTSQAAYVSTDATTGSNVLKVGASPSTQASVYYTLSAAPTSSILQYATSGQITLDFKVTTTTPTAGVYTFFQFDYGRTGAYWTNIGLYANGAAGQCKYVVRDYDIKGAASANEQDYLSSTYVNMPSVGWHTLTFTWQETVAGSQTVREQANLNYSIDGTSVYSLSNAYWSRPSIWDAISIGSFTSSPNLYYSSGIAGMYIDNVQVTPEPATMTLLIIGSASLLLKRRKA